MRTVTCFQILVFLFKYSSDVNNITAIKTIYLAIFYIYPLPVHHHLLFLKRILVSVAVNLSWKLNNCLRTACAYGCTLRLLRRSRIQSPNKLVEKRIPTTFVNEEYRPVISVVPLCFSVNFWRLLQLDYLCGSVCVFIFVKFLVCGIVFWILFNRN